MKRLICCLAILLSVIYSYAQKVYFVYLQADPEQAFYVRVTDNVYSSTAAGYLILSRLRDSSYSFTVGFPQNKWPEQQFKVDIRGKDHGYLLKNFGEKGWGLYDLQTLAVQMAMNGGLQSRREENKDISAFTDVLAKAANDPSLREKPLKKEEPGVEPQSAVVKMEEKKKDSFIVAKVTEPAVKKETVPALKENTGEKENDTNQAKEVGSVKKDDAPVNNAVATIIKEVPPATNPATGNKTENSVPATEKKKPDTILNNTVAKAEQTEIPKTETETSKNDPPKADPPKTETVNKPVAAAYKASVIKRRSESSTSEGFGLTFVDEYPDGEKDTIRILIPNPKTKVVLKEKEKEQPKDEKRFLDITADSKDVTPEARTGSNKEDRVKAVSCTQATENDFLKLRKRMAGASGDDAMVSEAVKTFRTRCFAVSQLKNLSTLFLNDAGKYKFFDAAYARVYDPANFASLQAELKDEYYINRFKAMLR